MVQPIIAWQLEDTFSQDAIAPEAIGQISAGTDRCPRILIPVTQCATPVPGRRAAHRLLRNLLHRLTR